MTVLDPPEGQKRPWRQRQRGWRGQMLRWVRQNPRAFDHFRAPFDRNTSAFGAFLGRFSAVYMDMYLSTRKTLTHVIFFTANCRSEKSGFGNGVVDGGIRDSGLGIRDSKISHNGRAGRHGTRQEGRRWGGTGNPTGSKALHHFAKAEGWPTRALTSSCACRRALSV